MKALVIALAAIFSSLAMAEEVTSEKGFIGLALDGQSMYFCAVHRGQESTPTGLGMRCIHLPIKHIRETSTECIALPDMKGNMQVLPRADVVCTGI